MASKVDFKLYETVKQGLAGVHEACKDQSPGRDGKVAEIRTICLKLLHHAASAEKLYHDNKLIDFNGAIRPGCDFSSIITIARAATETYLMFYWLFVERPVGLAEHNMRYILWRLAGSSTRMNLPTDRESARIIIEDEAKHQAKYMERLKRNAAWRNLTDGQRGDKLSLIKRRITPRPSWYKLIQSSSVSDGFQYLYSYCCEHAHSGRVAVCQLHNTFQSLEAQRGLCNTAFLMITVMMARMTKDYATLFKGSRIWLDGQSEIRNALEHVCANSTEAW